jgi:hypothetical protein
MKKSEVGMVLNGIRSLATFVKKFSPLKNCVFWDVMCSPLNVADSHLLHARLLLGLFSDPEDGDEMFLRKIG